MRLGIFGGTFDPVHQGHLILAEQCREQARLDKVLFMPAPRPPHKQDRQLAPYDHRLEMLSLATSGQPAFQVDDMEKDLPGPSFTAHTLTRLRDRYGEAELFLIVGSDTLHDLPQWYQPVRILELAGLLVIPRSGSPILRREEIMKALALGDSFPLRYQACAMPLIDISSRDLRTRINGGRSVRYLMPRAVEAYIHDKHLYRDS